MISQQVFMIVSDFAVVSVLPRCWWKSGKYVDCI